MSNIARMKAITTTLERPIARSLGMTFVFAAMTAGMAQIGFHLPNNPVPVTFQVLAMLLSGLLLGSRLGALAQLEYIIAGLAGAPIFYGFSHGPAVLLGPSGGYLPGMVLGASVTGLIFERAKKQDVFRASLAGLAGAAIVWWCGFTWLCMLGTATGANHPQLWAWLLGVAPFMGVDLLKVTVASMVATGKVNWKR